MMNRWMVCVALVGALAACEADDGGSDGADAGGEGGAGGDGAGGEAYYLGEDSAALGAEGNQSDCATCHSIDGSLARSGKSFQDIAYLTAYKGGDAPDLLAATNACVTGWMGGPALTAEDARYVALRGYLQSLSDAAVTTPNPLAPEVLATADDYETAYAGGDAAAGEAKYAMHCGHCHDSARKVGPAESYSKVSLKSYAIGRIAQKVRTSGPPPSSMGDAQDTTPGPMPFFELEDVSVDDLKDIIAHLKAQ